jgi:hypothetical protein
MSNDKFGKNSDKSKLLHGQRNMIRQQVEVISENHPWLVSGGFIGIVC